MSREREEPPEEEIRTREQRVIDGRDVTPAVGRRGGPGSWRRALAGARVHGFRPRFEDAAWSFLYREGYARAGPAGDGGDERAEAAGDGRDEHAATAGDERAATAGDGGVAAAARRMRSGRELPVPVKGPVIRPNVWTWEVPLYFWFGGIAAGASFAALACDVAGDERGARVARLAAIGAAGCGGPLLITDLGRPERFLHMFRIFKTRSPMSMGAWCLLAFSNTGGAAVLADLLGRRRSARVLSALTAASGTYLGSYTGVLLASTAVPVWNRSRAFLGPIFMCTAAGSGAAVVRIALTDAPATRSGLAALEAAAMTSELVLSTLNERRLGIAGRVFEVGRPGRVLKLARTLTVTGLLGRAAGLDRLPSALFLAAALGYRFGWVGAGRPSALDSEAVATLARARG